MAYCHSTDRIIKQGTFSDRLLQFIPFLAFNPDRWAICGSYWEVPGKIFISLLAEIDKASQLHYRLQPISRRPDFTERLIEIRIDFKLS